MTDLPPGWEWTTVGEIADTALGKMLDRGNSRGHPEVPYLRNVNVQWGRIDTDDVMTMELPPEQLELFSLKAGDLLVCEGGEIGRAAVWPGSTAYISFQKALHRVRPLGGVSSAFLLYAVRWLHETGRLAESSTGSTIKHLPQVNLRALSLPLPPLAEQRRIVEVVELVTSRLGIANETLRTAQARLNSMRTAVLRDSVPTDLPSRWRMTTVGDAGRVELGMARSPARHDGPSMRPYLRVANVFEDCIDLDDLKEMHFGAEEFERYALRPGDVLLNEGQSPELLGRPAMYTGEPRFLAFTNSLLRFQAGSEVLPRWALLVFRRHMREGRFMREVRITTNIAHLSAGRFKNVEFPIPPRREQERLCDAADAEFERIDRLDDIVRNAQAKSETLNLGLLEEAFSGRLTVQDPADEPGSALLGRMRADRAEAQPAGRGKRRAAQRG